MNVHAAEYMLSQVYVDAIKENKFWPKLKVKAAIEK